MKILLGVKQAVEVTDGPANANEVLLFSLGPWPPNAELDIHN